MGRDGKGLDREHEKGIGRDGKGWEGMEMRERDGDGRGARDGMGEIEARNDRMK